MRERLRHGAANPSDLLNGTWRVIAGELGGVRLPADAFDELTLTVWNGRVTLGRDRGLAALDRDVEPAALDVVIVAGPNRGRFVPAIVERSGPLLRVCYDLGGTERREHSRRRQEPATSWRPTGAPPSHRACGLRQGVPPWRTRLFFPLFHQQARQCHE